MNDWIKIKRGIWYFGASDHFQWEAAAVKSGRSPCWSKKNQFPQPN